jgi:transposase
MAAREGVEGIPPNSLITASHSYAAFLKPVIDKLRNEVLEAKVVYMDETPHKMLEGDDTKNWFLWGFSSATACIFEAHNTRSGDVPFSFLTKSLAIMYLVTDGYSGYKKALRNLAAQGKAIEEVFCNAHAFRYFRDASSTWSEEAEPFLELYGKIFKIERDASGEPQKNLARNQMRPLFEKLKGLCESLDTMPGSSLEKAKNYFLNQYIGLTRCIDDIAVPLDNNFSERLLRSPVVGRKTWLGTHSRRGAETAAILFSLVESCKINQINPRSYFGWVTKRIHDEQPVLTPSGYAKEMDSG